jgi:hypothetical protein
MKLWLQPRYRNILCASSNIAIAVDKSTDRFRPKSGGSCCCCPEEGGVPQGAVILNLTRFFRPPMQLLHRKRKMTLLPPKRRCVDPQQFLSHLVTPPAAQADELRRAEDERKAEERRAAEVHALFNASFPILTVTSGCRSRAQG